MNIYKEVYFHQGISEYRYSHAQLNEIMPSLDPRIFIEHVYIDLMLFTYFF